MTKRIVQKFGGTSVGDIEKIRNVARIVTQTAEEGNQVVVIVSAMGHSTDHLVDLVQQVMPSPPTQAAKREYDALLATGEMVSTSLLALAIQSMGYDAIGLNGQQAGVITEDLHTQARILAINTENIEKQLAAGKIVIVTGFQGTNTKGDITTLGRGGSDTSAVALAGSLDADRCDIFTDVRGVYSTDPRIVPEAIKHDRVTYIEMMELARVGAQVLHPRAVETAREFDVQLCVRSTFHLEDPGTMITNDHVLNEDGSGGIEDVRKVTGIACDDSQARLAIVKVPDRPGIASLVFNRLAEASVSVDMIIQSMASDANHTNDIAFTVSLGDLPQAQSITQQLKEELGAEAVQVDTDIAKLSIVGVGMIDRPGIAAEMFSAMAEAGINIKMISTSEIKISCLVEKAAAKKGIQAVHKAFFPVSTQAETVMVSNKVGY